MDDMPVVGSSMHDIIDLKEKLAKIFEMKDLGEVKQILGMKITRDKQNHMLRLNQKGYIEKVLKRFNMKDEKPVTTPLAKQFKLTKKLSPKLDKEKEYITKVPYASMVGSLMYSMVCTRPNIALAMGVVSRFMNNPRKGNWEAVKWILRYLRGTSY